jgi:transposase-like protein
MGRKSKFTPKQKIEACERYLNGKGSYSSIALELGIDWSTFREWVYKYKNNGKDCFQESKTNKSYSSVFKKKVIEEYLDGKKSILDIAAEYNISFSMAKNWVKKYNNGEEIKDYDPKSEVYSMKSRKTTIEERIEIVKYALDNNNDYKGAADMFLVPYANVYKWVKMYNELGEEGLKEHRGRPKNSIIELTELEKKDLEIAKLKLELEKHKRAEEILKKNLEIRKQLFKDSRK